VAATGPAVFYRLRTLVPGDTVHVTRADHRVAVFRIYRVAAFAKKAFPTRKRKRVLVWQQGTM